MQVHTYQINHNYIVQNECSSKVSVSSKIDVVVIEDIFIITLNYLPHQICKDFAHDHGVELTYNQEWHLKREGKGVHIWSCTWLLHVFALVMPQAKGNKLGNYWRVYFLRSSFYVIVHCLCIFNSRVHHGVSIGIDYWFFPS